MVQKEKTLPDLPNLQTLTENGIRDLMLPEKPVTLYDPIRYILSLGGKRIRPQLVLLSCGLCGGDIKEAIPVSLAIELVHNFTLIHDDIMDKAETRRGKMSVHRKWDDSIAILSGDVMFAYAFDQLHYYGRSEKFSKEEFLRLNELFIKAVKIVCEGQALDLEFEKQTDVTLPQYVEMISAKTAALLQCSLQMGAIVAKAHKKSIEQAGLLGLEAGIAFQIQDDLLDAIANPDKFGKRVGGDIYEGKKTFLSILALSLADDGEKEFLLNILQKKQATENEVNDVIQLYYDLGVIDRTKLAIKEHYEKALDHLNFFESSEYLNEIDHLLKRLTNRDR